MITHETNVALDPHTWMSFQVLWVSMRDVTSREAMCANLVRCFAVEENGEGPESIQERGEMDIKKVSASVGDKRMLLVLDNMEVSCNPPAVS